MSNDNPTPEEQPEPETSATDEQPVTDSPAEPLAESAENDAAFCADTEESASGQPDLEAVIAERDEAKDKWLRAEAEMENVRRRAKNEVADLRKYQSLGVIRDSLSPIDNLRLAVDAAQKSGNVEELVKGIEMVLNQFDSVFNIHGAKLIECEEGQAFDPNMHEAITQVPSADHEPMTIMMVAQRGYVMGDRVIRPSKVVVSAAMPKQEEPATEE